MLRQIKDPNEAIGMTVSAIVVSRYTDQIAIVFGETFLLVECDSDTIHVDKDFHPRLFGISSTVDAGIATHEEVKRWVGR